MPTKLFYPVAGSNSPMDGYVMRSGVNQTWANIRAGAGTASSASGTELTVQATSSTTRNQWAYIIRAILCFDTSSLTAGAVISSATLHLYGSAKRKDTNELAINIFTSTPARTATIADSDYSQLGNTALCDTAIAYTTWSTSGYNNFALNAAGISAISITGVTKLGLKSTLDTSDTPPTWVSDKNDYISAWAADKGTIYKPYLEVTYTTPTYTLVYTASNDGKITGSTTQTVYHGGDGTTVTAVNYRYADFDGWSDGYPTAVRTDTNVVDDLSVTANFSSRWAKPGKHSTTVVKPTKHSSSWVLKT